MQRYLKGDLNDNGTVDLFDFLRLNKIYMAANPGAAALSLQARMVPEPGSMAVALLGLAAAVLSRCRRRAAAVAL